MSKVSNLKALSNKSNLKWCGRVRGKKLFPETMIYKIFETNSSFSCEIALYGKSSISALQDIFAILTKYSSWDED